MPVSATFHNTIFDIRCSKCKKSDHPVYFTQNGNVYKTCNACRARGQQRRRARAYDNLSPEFRAHLGILPHLRYHDTDDVNDANAILSRSYDTDDDVDAVLAMSSSAAAASTYSADYFVDEPDPEPEP